jgi:hypothetical protein
MLSFELSNGCVQEVRQQQLVMIGDRLQPLQSGSLATIDVLSDDESPSPSPQAGHSTQHPVPRQYEKHDQVREARWAHYDVASS